MREGEKKLGMEGQKGRGRKRREGVP